MESVGARLKKIRLGKGLSLEEAHKKTKIHADILKAIEEDGIINLSPIYIKGFLRIYCEFLGVSPKDFLSSYQEMPQPKEVYSEKKEYGTFSYLKAPAVKLKAFKPRIKLKFIIIALVIIVLVFLIIGLTQLVKAKRSQPTVNKRPLVILPKKTGVSRRDKVVSSIAAKTTESPSAKSKNPAVANPKSANAGIRLGMYVKEDSWVELKVDGKTVLRTVLKRGKFESWTARDKIELSVGNAQGIELEVNTKRMPPLGRRGQSLKNILITKDGLSVPR